MIRRVLLAALLTGSAMAASAADIAVTATYLARIATPPGSILEVLLLGETASGAGVEVLDSARLLDAGNPPYAAIVSPPPGAAALTVHARLRGPDGHAFFAGEAPGTAPAVELVMRPATADPATLHGTRWRLLLLDGAPVASLDGERDMPWIEFLPEGRVAGTGGCNRLGAGYSLGADGAISFTQGLSTMMACDEAVMGRERAVFDVMAAAATHAIEGDTLVFEADGRRLAVWVADPV